MKDSDILLQIAEYLNTDVRLSGILYLHPITTRRVGGAATRNLQMFQHLVGDDNMRNVKLVTTMWDEVAPEKGRAYLEELRQEFWGGMIAAGAQVDNCYDAARDGRKIISSIMKTSPVTLQFQHELQLGLPVDATAAGRVVMDQLRKIEERYEREMTELRDKLAEANTTNGAMMAALQRRYEEKLQKQEEASEQRRKLQQTKIEALEREVEGLKKEKEKKENEGCTIL